MEITKRFAKTLKNAASESNRYAINGVLLHGNSATVTDGRRLVAQRCGGEPIGKCVADRGDMLQAVKSCTTVNQSATVTYNGNGAVTVSSAKATAKADVIEGHFPQFQDVCPRDIPPHTIAVNADYLAEILAAVPTDSDGSGYRAVNIAFQDDSARPVVLWKCIPGAEFYAALMPIRSTDLNQTAYTAARKAALPPTEPATKAAAA